MSMIVLVGAILLDQLIGEPKKWHPLIGFGWLAHHLEVFLNGDAKSFMRLRGVFAVSLLVIPITLIVVALQNLLGLIVDFFVIYLAIGAKSLAQHGRRVIAALRCDDIVQSRASVSRIVSRDCDAMNPPEIAAATIESLLENGADAIFGVIFWYLVAGVPGVIVYRLVNTLDAMWGYRTARYQTFGWFAARLDDVMNWLPARLTAISYAIAGNWRTGFYCWSAQAKLLESPNGGVVMSCGAGALGLKLGGPCFYHGQINQKCWFGQGATPCTGDIYRALDLVHESLFIWMLVIVAGGLFFA
ncbi:MAG: adenosylcobinamide-phosphate synthase CbiB [Sedimenticola sp.]|nr:adenosylcobinamide-phosphate synthase CbiB [Sedimenticola sp.]